MCVHAKKQREAHKGSEAGALQRVREKESACECAACTDARTKERSVAHANEQNLYPRDESKGNNADADASKQIRKKKRA